MRKLYGLLSASTLLAGLLIYFFFRDFSNMILFTWIPKPTLLEKVLISLKPSIFSNILKYHLPDMLWFVSGILFLRFIWFNSIKTQKVYVLSFYGIGLAIETSQLSDKVYGTFDWFDLFFMCIGAFVESLLYKKIILRRYL